MEQLTVIDMHTGGEPLRIITGGYPDLPDGTILQKRAYVRDNLDHLRKILMFEPRGHTDQYGALLVKPDLPGADIAVLFMHNEGYSTMCGHAVIALGRYAVDQGLVKVENNSARVNIECPCGMVVADVAIRDGKPTEVSFESVPSFVFLSDGCVEVPGHGEIHFDIAYGGAFYALAKASDFGLRFDHDPVSAFIEAGDRLTKSVAKNFPLSHPEFDDLAFLYGSILVDDVDPNEGKPTRNICVFADRQVDRSPTGSGVTARMAAMHARGQVGLGEARDFESFIGTKFSGIIVSHTRCGDFPAVTVRVSGRAFYTGRSTFTVEGDDPLSGGFLVR